MTRTSGQESTRPFWQGWWSARSVVVVEVNGYTIEPGANLVRANLEEAHLEGARFGMANLRETYLVADLEWADLEGAKANEDTTWPEGFDPVAAGVTFT